MVSKWGGLMMLLVWELIFGPSVMHGVVVPMLSQFSDPLFTVTRFLVFIVMFVAAPLAIFNELFLMRH